LALKANTTPFTISDTNSKKPKPMTMENESILLVISFFQPVLGFALTLQI
jgi:hypothetical protein